MARADKIGCIVFSSLALAVVFMFRLWEPGYLRTTRGLVSDMKGKVDVDEVHAWMVANGHTAASEKTDETSNDVDRNSLPQSIQKLRPAAGVFIRGEWMIVYWGCGFGHWGLKIGPKGRALPTNDREYSLPVEDGVYAWHELQ